MSERYWDRLATDALEDLEQEKIGKPEDLRQISEAEIPGEMDLAQLYSWLRENHVTESFGKAIFRHATRKQHGYIEPTVETGRRENGERIASGWFVAMFERKSSHNEEGIRIHGQRHTQSGAANYQYNLSLPINGVDSDHSISEGPGLAAWFYVDSLAGKKEISFSKFTDDEGTGDLAVVAVVIKEAADELADAIELIDRFKTKQKAAIKAITNVTGQQTNILDPTL